MKNINISNRPISILKSPHLSDEGLGEIYQSVALKMALLTRQGPGEFTRITPYVVCRDFLVDVYTYNKANKAFQVYGMKFDPTLERPQLDGVFLSLIFPTNETQENFEKNLEVLFNIELANGMEVSEYIPVEDEKKTTVLLGSAKWLANCLTFSLYTALLRVLCYKLGDDWIHSMSTEHSKKTDGVLVTSIARETWEKILSDLKLLKTEVFCGFDPSKSDVFTVHHNSGLFSVFGTHRELSVSLLRNNKHWKQFKAQGWKLHTQ